MKKALLAFVFLLTCGVTASAQQAPTGGCNQSTPINLTANGRLLLGKQEKKIVICSIDIVSATAQNIALVEGSGSTCGTSTAGMAGGATAVTGWNFAANGGMTKGDGGKMVFVTATTANDVCIFTSSTGQISGSVQWAYVP